MIKARSSPHVIAVFSNSILTGLCVYLSACSTHFSFKVEIILLKIWHIAIILLNGDANNHNSMYLLLEVIDCYLQPVIL